MTNNNFRSKKAIKCWLEHWNISRNKTNNLFLEKIIVLLCSLFTLHYLYYLQQSTATNVTLTRWLYFVKLSWRNNPQNKANRKQKSFHSRVFEKKYIHVFHHRSILEAPLLSMFSRDLFLLWKVSDCFMNWADDITPYVIG